MSPSSRTTSLTFRCPNDLADWLQTEAERPGSNMSQVIIACIEHMYAHDPEYHLRVATRKDDDADV